MKSSSSTQHEARAEVTDALAEGELLALYRGLVRTRRVDEALARLVRQGAISKAWPSTGEEAVAVGVARALTPGVDVIAPVIRNSGACHEFGMPAASVFRAYLGTADGTARAGTTHKGLNLAAVQRVPAVFVIQNNQVALGTPVGRHGIVGEDRRSPFASWPLAYGMWGAAVDGNDVLDCYAATRLAADRCRAGAGPVMLIAETFRMGGHATHDEADARRVLGPEPYARWGARDPLALCRTRLRARGVSESALGAAEHGADEEVAAGLAAALESRAARMPRGESGIGGVYAG